jgi:TRAP transporter TAXI family solute receptor
MSSIVFLALALLLLGARAASAETVMRLCTGSPGKTYIKVGEQLAQVAPQLTAGGLKIEVLPSGGSMDNMNRALAGECDAFIAQGDAIDFFSNNVNQGAGEKFRVMGELYKELTLLVCRRGSNIDDLEELSGGTVAAGNMGSGSLATMLNLQRLDPERYGDIKIHPANGFEGAMDVIAGKADCMLDVIAPQSDLIRTLNDNTQTGSELYFAEIDDDDLEDYEVDGKRIYQLVTFDDETYPELSTIGDPEILAISAVLVLNQDYAQANPSAVSAVSMLLLMGKKDIESVAYGEKRPFDD